MRLPIIFITILILLGVTFGYFVSWPLYQSWQTQQDRLTRLSAELKTSKQRRAQAKEIAASAPIIHEKALSAKQLVPVAEERETFISEYDALAKRLSVSLAVLNFQKANSSSKTTDTDTEKKTTTAKKTAKKVVTLGTPLGFTSNLVGTYPNLRQLTTDIRKMHRYVRITSLSILGRENDATVTLDGEIYTQAEPKTPDTVEVGPKIWEYLDTRLAPQTGTTGLSTGRINPFATY
jgi:hypothetical protein